MKEFKTLGYDWECGHEDLIIRVLSYADRKRLYIGLYKEENGEWEDFGNLTVNLPREAVKENEAFIDHNYSESKLQFIRKYQLGKFYLKQPYQDTVLFQRQHLILTGLQNLTRTECVRTGNSWGKVFIRG